MKPIDIDVVVFAIFIVLTAIYVIVRLRGSKKYSYWSDERAFLDIYSFFGYIFALLILAAICGLLRI